MASRLRTEESRPSKGIDLEVRAGELVTLIGANGAGKTTTLKAITGTQAWSGEVDYMGASTRGQAPYQLLAKGLTMVPEGRGVFARMSVTENLQMGAFVRKDTDGVRRDIDQMFTVFPRLKERAKQLAGTLSGGEQQMLAMARALMSEPKLLVARRTVDGPGAASSSKNVRSDPVGRRKESADVAGRTKCAARIGSCAAWVRNGVRLDYVSVEMQSRY